MQIVRIFQIGHFSDFPNLKLFEFGMSQVKNFRNSPNWNFFRIFQTKKISIIFQFGKPKFGLKNYQFRNSSSIRHSALLAILSIVIFALQYKWIFSISISYCSISHDFAHPTSERSLILKFPTSAILNLNCSKFNPSSIIPQKNNENLKLFTPKQ